MAQLIPISDVFRRMKYIRSQVSQGKSFMVLSHSRPVFQIGPVPNQNTDEEYVEYLDDNTSQSILEGLQDIAAGKTVRASSPEEIDNLLDDWDE